MFRWPLTFLIRNTQLLGLNRSGPSCKEAKTTGLCENTDFRNWYSTICTTHVHALLKNMNLTVDSYCTPVNLGRWQLYNGFHLWSLILCCFICHHRMQIGHTYKSQHRRAMAVIADLDRDELDRCWTIIENFLFTCKYVESENWNASSVM